MRRCNCFCGFLCGIATLAWPWLAMAQTIQLPSFNVFSVDTTVLVPDSGWAPLAGNRRASSGTNSFGGLGRQRATGSDRQVAGAYLTAQVHDMQEIDRAVLRNSGAKRSEAETTARRTAPGQQGAESKLESVDALRRRRVVQATAEQHEAALVFDRAREAQAAGKFAVATIYYRSAAKQATGTLRAEILAAWKTLKAEENSGQASPTAE